MTLLLLLVIRIDDDDAVLLLGRLLYLPVINLIVLVEISLTLTE